MRPKTEGPAFGTGPLFGGGAIQAQRLLSSPQQPNADSRAILVKFSDSSTQENLVRALILMLELELL